jgi:dynein heavy chain
MWTEETIRAFDDLEGGSERAMIDHRDLIILRIKALIDQVRNPLTPDIRVKIITIITIDVHERDVIAEFVYKNVNDQSMFIWVRQLRFYMEFKTPKDDKRVCVPKICDW